MARFEGNKRVEGSRSNTALVKSGHNSPAESWMLDPRFKDNDMTSIFQDGALFPYQYGGAGMEDVVIPKGRVVGVAAPVKDFVSKKMKSVITMPGLALNGNTIGMAPYNFTKDLLQEDKFGGNAPSVITTDYVTLPYIPTVPADARFTKAGILAEEGALSRDLKMPWGAVIGTGVTEGSYLKATPSGRLSLWSPVTLKTVAGEGEAPDTYELEGDDPSLIVGQVLASDFNQEQFGWLKWMLWNEADVQGDDNIINRSGSSSLPTDEGYPYDPAYRDGNNVFQFMQTSKIVAPTGIPNLHDGSGDYTGYGKNDTEYTDIVVGGVAADAVNDSIVDFQMKDFAGGKLTNLLAPVVVKVDGVAVSDATRITVNYKTGVISLKVKTADQGKAVTVTCKAMHFGTSSYLDFKGVVGAFYVLLKK